jgi:hypothetical protein
MDVIAGSSAARAVEAESKSSQVVSVAAEVEVDEVEEADIRPKRVFEAKEASLEAQMRR